MRLAACYFEVEPGGKWGRLARVLEASARAHLPAWALTVERLPLVLHVEDRNRRTAIANSAKLAWWAEQVAQAPDGERLLLIDADTLILRPLEDVWTQPFDLAYTTKAAGARFPLNGGVIFLRIGPAVRAFVQAWRRINDRLLADPAFHTQGRYRYGGINQTAFGELLRSRPPAPIGIRALACREWNCEDESWAAFDPAVTRILHIKAALRLACFHTFARTPELAPLAQLWQAAERRAQAAEDRPA